MCGVIERNKCKWTFDLEESCNKCCKKCEDINCSRRCVTVTKGIDILYKHKA